MKIISIAKNVRKIFYFILLACLIQSVLFIKVSKKSRKARVGNITSNSKKGLNKVIVYNKSIALAFTKNLVKLIINTPSTKLEQDEFTYNLNKCFSYFNEKPDVLKDFYLKCQEISDNPHKKWNTNIFDSIIMSKLAFIRIMKMNGQVSTCQLELPYNKTPNKDKIAELFNDFFNKYKSKNSLSALPFISSHFSIYRNHLPENAFINMNKESGLKSDILYPLITKSTFLNHRQ